VLCYYAYSLLYTAETAGQGNPVRTSLLGPDKCIGMQMNLALTQDIPSNGSGSLSIKLQHPDGGGVLAPAAGVPYRLTTTGGIASPASGITDAQGNATANVTPSQNATSIQVVAVATAPTSGTVLAQGAASAAIVQGTETSRSDYAGGFVRTCRGLTFPGRSPPPPVVTSGSATATFSVNKGQANFATVVAPTDIFFQLGRILTLAGVPENFDGFTDAGNGFVWTVTGSRSAATLTMSVEEIGNNCTFVFDGQVVP
jgi:hypothetical protein